MTTPRKPVLISMRMGNHASRSGYDRLCQAMDADVITTARPDSWKTRAIGHLAKPLIRRSGSLWYNRQSATTEFEVGLRWLGSRRRVFHFLYGENSLRYLPAARRLLPGSNRLMATFHTPDWRMNEVVKSRRFLQRLDAVVVVSSSQLAYWNELIGEERSFFVPHGIDTDYFVPGDGEHLDNERPIMLTVGHHLRDFDTLAGVANAMRTVAPEVEFVVVSRPDRLGPLSRLDNVRCLSGISDSRLLELYQAATALFMPLRDATANNALLEAMSCGLPIVATDIQGVRDYVPPEGSILHHNGIELFTDTLAAIASGRIDLHSMGLANRSRADELAWPQVAAQLADVHRRVAA